ncbi:MAG: hypothetical protein WCJ35_27780 [Planctomycetota bacterium]
MLLYHRTFHAEAILREGFRDQPYLDWGMGIWFSADGPLDVNEGADGDTVLVLDIPDDVAVKYEVVQEEGCFEGESDENAPFVPCAEPPYLEFFVPADVLKPYGPPRIFADDYRGFSRKSLLELAERLEAHGGNEGQKKADRVRAKIPFLEQHGLLGEIEDEGGG